MLFNNNTNGSKEQLFECRWTAKKGSRTKCGRVRVYARDKYEAEEKAKREIDMWSLSGYDTPTWEVH